MKKQSIRVIALLAVAGTFATGCDLLKDVEYTVTPDPLEMHGDSVRVKIDVVVPEKGIKKKAAAEITPMIGETPLKTIRIQGEKATGNGDVIAKAGGKVTYEDVVVYAPSMEATDLNITGKIYKGEKEKGEIEPTKVADATIITPYLVNKDFRVIIAKDEFRRVTQETHFAQINYDKGRSNVKGSELREDDIKELQAFLEEAQSNPKIEVTNIAIEGHASPEGEVDKNNNLSNDRAASGKEATVGIAKKAKHEGAQGEMYSLSGSGEDFAGFKRELEKDSLNRISESDKQLAIRLLETISDPAEREKEMRNLGKSFTQFDRYIFPLLRRAEINVNYDLTGFSDEELMANSVSNPDTLNLEELLFTATLYDDLNEKLRVYKIAEGRYGDDYRASNNVGAVLYMQNKLSEAKSQFEKANGIEDNPISKNNLAAIAGVEGDRVKAMDLLDQSSGAAVDRNEVNYNKGILNIQNGDYEEAVGNFGSEASFNKALAEMLNGGNASTVDSSPDAESAQGYYLKAVDAARQDKLDGIVSNLKSAIAKDGSLKAKAAKDREFIKYMENASFTAVVK
jgi:outer membrane protein OmpA-like peptidoglycan-associated protein